MNIQRTEMVPKQGEQGVDTCLKKKTKNQPILNYLASTELNVKKKKNTTTTAVGTNTTPLPTSEKHDRREKTHKSGRKNLKRENQQISA